MSGVTYYQWFMTEEHTQRIVGYEWWPKDGQLIFMHREEPGDTWGPPITIANGMPLDVARKLAEGEGFTVEVEVKQ